jgi:hypothetical protein
MTTKMMAPNNTPNEAAMRQAVPRFTGGQFAIDFAPTPKLAEALKSLKGKRSHRLDAYCARYPRPRPTHRWIIVSHG